MEYGEAINTDAFWTAVAITRRLQAQRPEPLAQLATEAVAQAYCVCVTDGEDAAEHRFSDVHRKLIDEVVAHVRTSEHIS